MGDWKQILGAIAPTLATALGGPFAGMAVKAASEALLGRDDGSEEEVASALLGATPDQLVAVKKAGADFAIRMKELDVDLDRIHAGDRDSARKRQAATGDQTPRNLAYLYASAFFGVIGFQCYLGLQQIDIPIMVGKSLDITLGVLTAMVLGSKEYYFGSSSSSAKKTDLLAQAEARR